MIDHVLGRPSSKFRKLQVFAVVSFWSAYLLRGNSHGPPLLRRVSERIGRRLTAWQTVVLTMLWLYTCRNFAKICGLASPEPLANLYTRSYFRATWVTTALDAGFWTAMPIRNGALRDLASMAFSVFYLFAAEAADEKVRKVRATLTVEHLRVSWNKGATPYLSALNAMLRPRLMKYPPRKIRIARPPESAYKDPVIAWLFFDGPLSALHDHYKVLLDVPGGGFVAMSPRTNDDRLMAWSAKLKIPVVSLDYRKAPEYPYPYALNEVYDVYSTIVQSQGRCLGLSGDVRPRIVMSGDSAGGNLATSAILMVLQLQIANAKKPPRERFAPLPTPDGLILSYPGLDMNIGNWMTDEQMSLIQDRHTRKTNASILRRKSEDYSRLTPLTPHHSDDEEESGFLRRTETTVKISDLREEAIVDDPAEDVVETNMGHVSSPSRRSSRPGMKRSTSVSQQQADVAQGKPQMLQTRLAMSSMISYFNDRVLTPEMMRSMIILYIGPHNRPDFATDFLLSPLLAPDALLARFPKTHFLTGERDPLVDDTAIFAGRIRQAKYAAWVHRRELGLERGSREFDEREHVEVSLIPGISHGFLQFVGVFPEGWKYIYRIAGWVQELLAQADYDMAAATGKELAAHGSGTDESVGRPHHVRRPTESSADEDGPLEMSMTGEGLRSSKSSRSRGRERRARVRRDIDRRQKSSASLASEEDLLGRRMQGLTEGLTGLAED